MFLVNLVLEGILLIKLYLALQGVVVDDFTITIKEIPFRVHFTVKALFVIKIYFRKNYSAHVQFCKKSSFFYIYILKTTFMSYMKIKFDTLTTTLLAFAINAFYKAYNLM